MTASPVATSGCDLDLVALAAHGDQVVERSDDQDRADDHLEDGPGGQSILELSVERLMNVLMNGFDHVFRRSLP